MQQHLYAALNYNHTGCNKVFLFVNPEISDSVLINIFHTAIKYVTSDPFQTLFLLKDSIEQISMIHNVNYSGW